MRKTVLQNKFKVLIERDEDGYFVATVPGLPGCHTQARDIDELRKRVREAIKLCLSVAKTEPQYKKKIKLFAYEPSFVGMEMINA